ncbi:fatty-acyl-CoA synthase [Halopolyspora algeriensis]|uniref:Long-chain-fatty-acid--CoA ligase n=1 Tax=Halopolyspora algeriensis TaxID=1500506 RepID=A0A368VY47_9ACTN|nr:AMP-binding protein [Halopolyspora algeriensis]RCW45762.1 fatty-acyl-CoA synthase [Halopolyspora algeriensis]TQM54146.1 fatty-acyl-CoA synthase [Halopolyspora algeriensis]
MKHRVTDESPHDLLSFLEALVRQDPDAIAVIDADPEQPVLVSRAQLWHRTLRLRHDLRQSGIGRGDCVAVWLPNWSDALCWQFAAASLGAHVIGVNTRYNVDEVAHVLERARPQVMALAHEFHTLDLADRLHRAVQAADASPPVVAVVSGPGRPPAQDPARYDVGAGSWVPATGAEDAPSSHEAFADELAVAFTTSGSTGKPKLAAHTQRGVTAHARADAGALGIGTGDVMLCALPLSGVFGFNTAMAALAGGGTCLFEPVFDENAVVADMARFAVTHAVGADDFVVRLERAWQHRPHDLTSWRWLGIADFLGKVAELAEWARSEFGTVTAGVYGSSELFALTAFWPHDEPSPRRWSGGGRVVSPDIRVRVVDPVSEEVLPAGPRGELQFRGPNVVDAYLGDPEAAQRSFTADGWFHSGDLGELDADGSFSYVCRMGDVLRLRGFLVEPAEIEYRLVAHEAVETAKVVGVRDAEGADQAVAFVVAGQGSTVEAEELRAWCAQGLAGFKVPRAVHVVEEMPTTSGTNGTKIRAATLREWAQQWETEKQGVSRQ